MPSGFISDFCFPPECKVGLRISNPQVLLSVMQDIARSYGNSVNLTQAEVDKLYAQFQTEAQQYGTQHKQYLKHDAYVEILKSVKSMLERMKTR